MPGPNSFKEPNQLQTNFGGYKFRQTFENDDEGLTLETSAFESLYGGQYQPSWWNQITLLYFPPTQHHSFVGNLPLYSFENELSFAVRTKMSASGLKAVFRQLIFRKQRSKRKRKAKFSLSWNEEAPSRLVIHMIATTDCFLWSLRSSVCDRRDRTKMFVDRNGHWSIVSIWSQQSPNLATIYGNNCFFWFIFSCFVLHFGLYSWTIATLLFRQLFYQFME